VAERTPSAKQFEDFAFSCAVGFLVLFVCALVDGYDGVVTRKSGTFRLADDPGLFWAAMIFPWGHFGLLLVIAMIAAGVGALVLKASEKASGAE